MIWLIKINWQKIICRTKKVFALRKPNQTIIYSYTFSFFLFPDSFRGAFFPDKILFCSHPNCSLLHRLKLSGSWTECVQDRSSAQFLIFFRKSRHSFDQRHCKCQLIAGLFLIVTKDKSTGLIPLIRIINQKIPSIVKVLIRSRSWLTSDY